MKKLSKKISIFGIVSFSILFVVGIILSFVPMQLGSKNYNSFFGSISTSNELGKGITATYEILDSPTQADLNKATTYFKKLLVTEGYPNASVYQLGNDKLIVEVSQPSVATLTPNTEELLKKLGGGQLILSTASTFDSVGSEGIVSIYAHKHFKEVGLQTYNSYNGVVVEFNKEGKDLYLQSSGKTLYMYLNGTAFPDTTNNKIDANYDTTVANLSLWFNTFDSAEYYDLVFRCGMSPIKLDSTAININASQPSAKIPYFNNTILACLIFLLIIMLASIVFVIVKYRAFGVISTFSFAFIVIIALFLFQAMSWIEINIASIVSIIAIILLNFYSNILIFNKVSDEFKLGKSIETSIDTGYRKTLPIILEISILTTVLGIMIAVIGHDSFASIGSIIAVGGTLNILNSIVLVKLFTNIYFTFNNTDEKKYALKKENK